MLFSFFSVFLSPASTSTVYLLRLASVFLKMAPGARLTGEEVRGIVHLVASSVEGLDVKNVTVADSKGTVLSTGNPARTAGRLAGLAPDLVPLHTGPRAIVLRLDRTDVTIRLVTPDMWAHALVWFTGSSTHVERLAVRAADRGLRFGRDGLRDNGRLVPAGLRTISGASTATSTGPAT